jgi:hypothetical protein
MSTRKPQGEPKQHSSAELNRPHVAPASRPNQQSDDRDEVRSAQEADQDDRRRVPDRTGGQNGAVDQKRNDEQQYHAAGVAHDPHNRTQERIDSGDPDAGDVDDETREQSAPFNKTYGHHP